MEHEQLARLCRLDLSPRTLVELFLVAEGYCPATSIEIGFEPGHEECTDDDWHAEISAVASVLFALALPFDYKEDTREMPWYALFAIAKDEDHLATLMRANQTVHTTRAYERDIARGKAFGIPDTAIHGFVTRRMKRIGKLPPRIRRSDYLKFLSFRLSRDHW